MKKILELGEQGGISDYITLEDIRTFLQTNEPPRHDELQQQHNGLGQPRRSTKKKMIKENDTLLKGGKLPKIMEKIIMDRRVAAQQAEINKLTKTLGDLEKMRVKNEDRTKYLDQKFFKSTAKTSQKEPLQRWPTLRRLAPLPAKAGFLNRYEWTGADLPIINHLGGVSVSYKNPALPGFMKPGNTLSVASTDTRYPKLPSLGKANEKASNTRRLYWTT
ncbi:uncharacterized protein LOC116223266 isoform X2 [Clupea harengus]|uniref:Uncharacterized protein LOC116223266 isoform X2 n=1 Tax=Clupea harengus TaxID=7950 RepID=A0A8M1KSR0_CLUHA|nr:uncharacterized protein LOC116223266 isoform X2 [Clupea harengus]